MAGLICYNRLTDDIPIQEDVSMKCKVCGAYNEDYLEYCEKCAAPLTADTESEKTEEIQQPENKQNKGQDYQSYVASTGETPPAWGFVKAPDWPKPEFDADTVSEEDIPQGYGARFNPRPANAPVQKVAANEGDEDFTNNVRMHKAEKPAAKRTAVQPSRKHEAAAPVAASAAYGYDAEESVSPARSTKTQQTVSKVTRTPMKPAKENIEIDDDDFDYDDEYEDRSPARARRKSASGGLKKNIVFIAAAAALVIGTPDLGEALAAGGAMEQGGAEAVLEKHHVLGDHLRREPGGLRHGGEGPQFGGLDEDGHAGQPVQDYLLLVGSIC